MKTKLIIISHVMWLCAALLVCLMIKFLSIGEVQKGIAALIASLFIGYFGRGIWILAFSAPPDTPPRPEDEN